jgi:hypothetical protein
MSADKLFLDGVELSHISGLIRANGREARDIGAALPTLQVDFPADDPVRTHRHFTSAFTEFTTAWGKEVGFIADAAKDISIDLSAAAKRFLELDSRLGAAAATIVPGNGTPEKR